MEAQEWVSQEKLSRDSLPQAEESLLRQAEIETNRQSRRRDGNQMCGAESDDEPGHARKLRSVSLGRFEALVYSF